MSKNRRAFVRGIGTTLLAAGVAGCTDMGGETDGGDDQAQQGGTETDGAADAGNETETTTAAEETGGNETTGNETTGNESDVQGTLGEQSNQDLEVVRHSYFERDDQSGVEGVIRNTSDTDYELVTVHITPRADEQTEAGKDYPEQQEKYRDTLAAGATWEFRVVFEDPEVQSPDSYVVWVTGQEAS